MNTHEESEQDIEEKIEEIALKRIQEVVAALEENKEQEEEE